MRICLRASTSTWSRPSWFSVLDGDSIVAVIDGIETDVRLEGINTPERDECLGDAARANLESLIIGADLQIAGTEFDQFDRLLGVVVADGVPANVAQVLAGLAIPLAIDSSLEDVILAAEVRARADRVGVWNETSCGGAATPQVSITGVEWNPAGRDEENLDGEFVTIRNDSDAVVDLTGWVLRDESTANRFEFPNGFSLMPNGEVRVVVGCSSAANQLAWCSDRPIWNNAGDTALLMSPEGRIVDLFRYRDDG